MARDDDREKLGPTKLLFGEKEAPKAPPKMYQEQMRYTPDGTKLTSQLTREGQKYQADWATYKERAEAKAAALSKAPVAPDNPLGQARNFSRGSDQSRGKLQAPEKGDDLER